MNHPELPNVPVDPTDDDALWECQSEIVGAVWTAVDTAYGFLPDHIYTGFMRRYEDMVAASASFANPDIHCTDLVRTVGNRILDDLASDLEEEGFVEVRFTEDFEVVEVYDDETEEEDTTEDDD